MAVPHHELDDDPIVAERAADLAGAVRRAQQGERVAILDDDARPVAAIVSLDDVERLRLDDLRRERAAAAIRAFGELFEGEDRDDLDRRVTAAVAEAGPETWAARFPGGA
jgi:antitoxin (DNA-binding transcriptional repressor) of toxin-antitoxin stability system